MNKSEGVVPQSDKFEHKFAWAIDIVRKQFEQGLSTICDENFLSLRYQEFQRKNDPIYAELLQGMEDEALAKTFVSYWTIAQTLATQSRFWLENAVVEIIVEQVKNKTQSATEVYSKAMLMPYFEHRVPIDELVSKNLVHVGERNSWEVPILQSALQKIDILTGEQERTRKSHPGGFHSRHWTNEKNTEAIVDDRYQLMEVANSCIGSTKTRTRLQCNLLVIGEDKTDRKTHAWAIRFINPTTISKHADRKQERVNLLRLYAYLIQEKITPDPELTSVYVAELLPRKRNRDDQDHFPDYFSTHTYWSSEQLWKFIGVPFEVVSTAIKDVSKEFRSKLKNGLRTLLPKAESNDKKSELF